jgi:putrescine transport system substrate-binding protein
VPYLWGTQGFAYNYGRLREVLGRNPEPSWKLLFDPAITGRLRDCGIAWQDGAGSIMADLALLAIGADPAAEDLAALARAEAALLAVRGDVRYIDNSNRYRSDLASGEICIATGPSGDLVQARELARTSGSGADLRYVIPLEGGLLWVDLLAIPVDAPDPEAAHILINYLLEPAVIARVTTASRYANANRASDVWLEPRVRGDPAIYPEAMAFERLRLVPSESLEYTRERTRMWTRVRTAAGATAPD